MNIYKNSIKVCSVVAISMVLGACASRSIPDELVLVKYAPLEMPQTLHLVKPDKDAKPLGYKTSRTRIDTLQGVDIPAQASTASVKASAQMLSALKLQFVDMNISDVMQKPMGEQVVIMIDKEKARLAKNIAEGNPLTQGDVPRVLTRRTKTGFDQLFGE